MLPLAIKIRTRTKGLVLLSILNLQFWHSRLVAIDLNPVNDSPESKRLGDVYNVNMKSDLNPCVDFYKYVCYNWEKHNPKPLFHSMWNVETTMQHRAYENLKQYMEGMTHPVLRQMVQAKHLYTVCDSGPSLGRLDIKTIKKIMLKNSVWAMFLPINKQPPIDLPWKIDNFYIELTGESALFDGGVIFDDYPTADYVTELNALTSPYGMLIRHVPWSKTGSELKHYKNFLMTIIKQVAPDQRALSSALIQNDLDKVIQFRENLREIIHTRPKILRRTIIEFQNIYNKLRKPFSMAEINWLHQICAVYKKPIDSEYCGFADLKITNESRLLADINYFSKLVNLLDSTERRVIVNHIHLYFLERHLELNKETIKHLEHSVTDRILQTGKLRVDQTKWIKCLSESNLQIPLGKMYVYSSFKKGTDYLVNNLLEHAKELLQKEILNAEWLDSRTKHSSIDKLKNLEAMIGFPHWYYKNSLEPRFHAFHENPLNIKAMYNPSANRISVTAANLQWPVYSPNLPYVIDYGSTVAMLAHELYHAFDKTGITESMPGLYKNWSLEMQKKFDQHVKCFKDQYDEYREQELKYLRINETTRPRFTLMPTLNEDVADVMGLKLAYKGYKEKLLENDGVCPILPKFKKFTCDKLFFIAFANTNCYSATNGRLEYNLVADMHSSFNVRVNGAVANMKEFSDAFKCKPNDPLNLQKRCDLWK